MQIGSNTHRHTENIQKLLQGLVQLCVLPILKLFFKVRIIGAEQAFMAVQEAKSKEKGMLFAANHTSEWDAILVRCALPIGMFSTPMYYVAMTKDHYQYAKFGWRRYFYGGTFFKMLGAYPAYLGMRDYQASLVNHIELLEHAKSVCIFPEGKISVDTLKPTEPKGGIAFLAEQTNTDIIPVKVSGLTEITWKNMFTFKRAKITIEYKPLLITEELIAQSKADGFEKGPEMYKHMAGSIMEKIRV